MKKLLLFLALCFSAVSYAAGPEYTVKYAGVYRYNGDEHTISGSRPFDPYTMDEITYDVTRYSKSVYQREHLELRPVSYDVMYINNLSRFYYSLTAGCSVPIDLTELHVYHKGVECAYLGKRNGLFTFSHQPSSVDYQISGRVFSRDRSKFFHDFEGARGWLEIGRHAHNHCWRIDGTKDVACVGVTATFIDDDVLRFYFDCDECYNVSVDVLEFTYNGEVYTVDVDGDSVDVPLK